MTFNQGIVGYAYRADTYCTSGECIPLAGLTPGVFEVTEQNLAEIAATRGINRDDEYSFDSDDFPKVVLSVQIDGDEHCATCGDSL